MRAALLAVIAVAIVALVLVQQVVRAQSGPIALASVFELHLLGLALVLAILAIAASFGAGRGGAWVRLAAAVVIVAVVVRTGGELYSPSVRAGGADAITVLSWNLEMDSKAPDLVVAGLADSDADLVALQELTPEYGAAIDADDTLRARYPFRLLDVRPNADGLGLLSRLPLVHRDGSTPGRILRAGVRLPDGRTIEVLDVHPHRPLYRSIGPIPVSLNARDRDQGVAAIRAAVDALDDPAAALVIGDLNGTSSEPGLETLDRGLTDAHEAAGTGPGFTWRPDALEPLGVAVLRIDHVMSGAWLRPVATSIDCSAIGDHCRLTVTLDVTDADD
jgi:vancomycin resistance protein VanJ